MLNVNIQMPKIKSEVKLTLMEIQNAFDDSEWYS